MSTVLLPQVEFDHPCVPAVQVLGFRLTLAPTLFPDVSVIAIAALGLSSVCISLSKRIVSVFVVIEIDASLYGVVAEFRFVSEGVQLLLERGIRLAAILQGCQLSEPVVVGVGGVVMGVPV